MKTKEERKIETMNRIIYAAVAHGGDAGGPYYSNLQPLVEVLEEWLDEEGLKDKYRLCTYWSVNGKKFDTEPYFIKREDKDEDEDGSFKYF